MTASFVSLSLIAGGVFSIIDTLPQPIGLWYLPLFFLILTLALTLITKRKEKTNKSLSVGYILGVRFLFLFLILAFAIINMLLDRAHILPFTIVAVIYTLVFLIFETKILLIQNNEKV